jgi:pyridinium-3,5-biscarboxylic acid mononucleotide sulfurtransferase
MSTEQDSKQKSIEKNTETKIDALKTRLKRYGKVLVAFSGGKDSFFLLKAAVEALGKENAVACFVTTGFSTGNDRKRVEYYSGKLDFQLETVQLDITGDTLIMANPRERCYHCKKKIFGALEERAKKLGAETVLDGTTYSDSKEYRPGLRAIEELAIVSPLRDEGITSSEIVTFLEKIGIDDYYVTSSTCLATRFPYYHQLKPRILKIFDQLESYFVEEGIYPIKVRFIPEGIRIETPDRLFFKVLEKRTEIIQLCKKKGLNFVTLDLEGIKSGVWD